MGVTTNLRLGYVLVPLGIVLLGVLAVVISGKAASVAAGVCVLVAAAVRAGAGEPEAICARSTRFDVALLAVLGVGIIILALTADNI